MNRNRITQAGWISLAACGLFVAGCGGSKGGVEMRPVSASGESQYNKAKEIYIASRAKDERGEAHRQAMDQVARNLKGAIHNDQDCPLFYSRLGDVQLELGAPDRAFENFEESTHIYRNWVPGWLGLAAWGTRTGDASKLSYAQDRLTDAEKSLDALLDQTEKQGAGTVDSILLGGQRQQKKKHSDPSRSESEQLNLILAWTVANEQWLNENPTLASDNMMGMMMSGPITDKINRRLRARINYQRAEIAIAGHEPADRVIELLDEALRWDENFVTARIEKSAQLRKTGQYQGAESLLLPYLQDAAPQSIYKTNARLWFEAASNYTDWFISNSGGADVFNNAQMAFERLFDINENHADGWLKRAHLLYHGGVRTKNQQHLADAKTCVKNYRELTGGSTAATQLAQEIDSAMQKP